MRGSSSAPTARVLDVIELLSQPGNRRMRFSDIVRELELTQGTAHAILKTLSDRGWVARDHETKAFTLGPAASLLAGRLEMARPLTQLAHNAVRRLVEAVDMPASVVELAGNDLLITAFEIPPSSTISAAAHERIPYAPPFGVAFAAWAGPEEQREWIARGTAGDAALERRLREVLARTRRRGYDVDWMTPAVSQAAHALGTLTEEADPVVRSAIDRMRVEFAYAGTTLDPSTDSVQLVATVAAPVLDEFDSVGLILGVHPLQPMSALELDEVARSLLAEVARVQSEARAQPVGPLGNLR